ncbi:MAG: polymer-forming cytoskeletal protein [Gammaproteobacteria bacterium]|nr:polymer-forming cytoskeletal protein [Gammaproteobacteria bacterium]
MAKRRSHAEIETLIGAETTLSGDVNFSNGLYLEGRIEGNVSGTDEEARLDIQEAGYVTGEVHVANVEVNGTIEGELHASGRLVLGPSAQIKGDVFYNVLEMAAGAQVNGKLVYRKNGEPLAIEHKKAKSREQDRPSRSGTGESSEQEKPSKAQSGEGED